MAEFFSNSIFWIDVEKVKPNPYQPRREFDDVKLRDLSDSIRQYGILQPLVVTRTEVFVEGGGMTVEYELISGERRLRASKLAGIAQVPVIIRSNTDDSKVKLELAIIENLQREDLNAVDRAHAFKRLIDEFAFKHAQIGEKVGKSREYVSNTLRILSLPEEMLQALSMGKISEGHTRPLLMLVDNRDQQAVLFKEIIYKKMSVRESEMFARRIAQDRVRNREFMYDPALFDLEEKLAQSLGTRVKIEKKHKGGKLVIDFFSPDDLQSILNMLSASKISKTEWVPAVQAKMPIGMKFTAGEEKGTYNLGQDIRVSPEPILPVTQTPDLGVPAPVAVDKDEQKILQEDSSAEDEDMYSVKNFSL